MNTKMSKNLLCIAISLIIIISSCLPAAFAANVGSPLRMNVSEVPDSDKVSNGGEGTALYMAGEHYVEFTFNITNHAMYDISIYQRTFECDVELYVDGFLKSTTHVDTPGDAWQGPSEVASLGKAELKPGERKIKIRVAPNHSGTLYMIDCILQETDDEIVGTTEYTYNVGNSDMSNTNVPDDGSRRYGDGKEGNWGWSMSGDEYVTFNIAIEQEALYDLYVLGGGDTTTFSAELDGEYVGEGVSPICDWKIAQSAHLGTFTIPEGQHALRINVIDCEEHISGYNLKRIFIKKYEEIDIDTIKAGDSPLADGGYIKTNTDVINIEFTSDLGENNVLEDCFVLAGEKGKIPLKITVSDNNVQLALKKTFDDNASYTLDIVNVADKTGISSVSKTYGFSTFSYGAVNNADIADFTGEFKNNKFTAAGKVVSSVNEGIAGRKVMVSLRSPSSKIKALTECNTVSGENGEFNITYELPSDTDENGMFILIIATEYSSTKKNVEGMFFTEEGKKLLEESLLATKTAEDVHEFLEEYQTALFIDINIISHLSSDEQNIIYESFAGYDEPLDEFCSKWEKRAAIADVVYADDVSDVERILYDKERCELIGVDFNKIKSIVINKAGFTEEIYAIGKPSELNYAIEKDIADKINEILDKWTIKEFGKTHNALISEDDTIYLGQNAYFDLELANEETDAGKIVLVVESDDDNIAKSVLFDEEEGIESEVSYEDKKAVITLDFTAEEAVKKLGILQFSPPSETGQYTINVYGETVHDIEGIDFVLKTDIAEKTLSVNVEKKSGKQQGGGTSSSSTGKGSGSSSVMQPEKTDEPQVEAKDEAYTDIGGAEWAKEAINYLADYNIISKPEDKLFRPNDNVTREEFTKMVVNAMGLYNSKAETQLKDVEKGAWYYPYVASAESEGIILGNEKGLFNIGANITRQDMAVIIDRILEKAGYEDKVIGSVFADNDDIAEYAVKAVYNMRERNIINGVGENKFAPKNNATRAQAAKIIYEMLKVVGA